MIKKTSKKLDQINPSLAPCLKGLFFDQNILSQNPDIKNLIGIDEVGRGPLAGPVVACAVHLISPDPELFNLLNQLKITDSKKLSAVKRINILKKLGPDQRFLETWQPNKVFVFANKKIRGALAAVDAKTIDEKNILVAALEAMDLAMQTLSLSSTSESILKTMILVDGHRLPPEMAKNFFHCRAIVKGDEKSLAIALASIIAKECRDQLMKDYGKKFTQYGFEKHAGYPTALHREAIKKFGITGWHRKTFRGVREYLSQLPS
jgi:ribonuclease HII